MNSGKMKLVKGIEPNEDLENEKLDEFFGKKKEESKGKPYQTTIVLSLKERDLLKAGHDACLGKMPLYEYTKKAILDKAEADIEHRKKVDEMIKGLK